MNQPSDHIEPLWAHSENGHGFPHGLLTHSQAVSGRASEFAAPFASSFWAGLAGLCHDYGKARAGYQRYVRGNPDAHIEGRIPDSAKSHSAAGALLVRDEFQRLLGPERGALLSRILEYAIAGHHAGLADWTASETTQGLAVRLSHADAQLEYQQARAVIEKMPGQCFSPPEAAMLMEAAAQAASLRDRELPLARSLWLRMLFSALVDADFLDTEAHFDAAKGQGRADFPPLTRYREQLQGRLRQMAHNVHAKGWDDTPVMQARAAVLAQCLQKAQLAPGVFTLTVPTGGGKTLSSLAFALEHAVHHGLRRVVYAIPYTSIIEQTATVFGDIFGADNLVEHHSQADADARNETHRSRLACENWDAPLVVTTNVQLLESLFADKTSRCRKLHRLAGSVIVLDEAQLLPPDFLQPIVDALNVLLTHYRITLVLCTATQPVLTDRRSFDRVFRGLPTPRPIIDDAMTLFKQLSRTTIHWPDDLQRTVSWPELLPNLLALEAALVIVNTRRDAYELTRALPQGTLHLSAAMCGAHRQAVIQQIRERLRARQHGDTSALRVVSTQLIEAGVDVDFPVVYRALAGLDSIAQAAGRCNREGRQAQGDVHVFVRPIPKVLAQLRTAADATISVHAQGLPDALAPEAFERYFKLFYQRQPGHDVRGVVEELADRGGQLHFNFRTAAQKFRLIDDEDQVSLLVPYHLLDERHTHLEPLIAKLRQGETDRWLMRAVQRYTVTVRRRQMPPENDLQELQPGLYLLRDDTLYDRTFGLLARDTPLDAETLVQ